MSWLQQEIARLSLLVFPRVRPGRSPGSEPALPAQNATRAKGEAKKAMPETFIISDQVWKILQPWVGIRNVANFKLELSCDEPPRITVEYYPDQITAECLAVLIKQFKLVPVDAETDSNPEPDCSTGP